MLARRDILVNQSGDQTAIEKCRGVCDSLGLNVAECPAKQPRIELLGGGRPLPDAPPRCCAIARERETSSALYLAAAVLRSADAQASATARLGSACPGKVAHPVFIMNSVWS